jgi:hypothetical protein
MHAMRPSLLLCSLLLCLGCARSVEPMGRPDDAAAPESGAAVPSAQTKGPEATPSASGGTSAAIPTDGGNKGPSPTAQAAECRSDADCAITLVPEGECCARLCTGRAVTVAEDQALDVRERECRERGERCIIPPCAPPRTRPVAVCTGGRCGVREVPRELP